MNYNTNKKPANWVHSFNIGDGTRVYVSDKGAFKITNILPSGEEKFVMCLTPAQAKMLVNASGDIGNFLNSAQYKAIEQNKGAVKEKEKLVAQLEREKLNAIKTARECMLTLQKLGITEDEVKAG